MLSIFFKELHIIGNNCEIIDKNFGYTNKHRKIIEDEYESQFEDYREIVQEKELNILMINLAD